jgi:hypothetical protein
VPGAGHGKCAEIAGDCYQDKLAQFYAKHL